MFGEIQTRLKTGIGGKDEPPGSPGECQGGRPGRVGTKGTEQMDLEWRGVGTALIWGFIPSSLRLTLGTCQSSELSCEMSVALGPIINVTFSFISGKTTTHTHTHTPPCSSCAQTSGQHLETESKETLELCPATLPM